jgi:hypothetical protein
VTTTKKAAESAAFEIEMLESRRMISPHSDALQHPSFQRDSCFTRSRLARFSVRFDGRNGHALRTVFRIVIRPIVVVSLTFLSFAISACRGELPTAPVGDRGASPASAPAVPARRHASITYPALLPPDCGDPAPVFFVKHPAGKTWQVDFRSGTDAAAKTAELRGRFDILVISVLSNPPMLFAEMPAPTLAGIRCDPAVRAIIQDEWLGVP